VDQHGAADRGADQWIGNRPRSRSMALVRQLPLLLSGPDL
jgi:hypothetical protein